MKLMYRDIDISREMTETVILRDGFAEIRLNWFSLPLDVRAALVRDCLEQEMEYDEQWYFISIIIPVNGDSFEFHNTYFYIDELPANDEIYKEIGNAVQGKEEGILHSMELSTAETIGLISEVIPGISMTA